MKRGFYVYGFALIDAKGERTPIALAQNEWQYADVALLDFKDARGGNAPCTPGNPAKNTSVVGNAPQGAYVGLEFSVGAPVESIVDGKPVSINHSNVETAPPPLDISGMAWNWQAGRRFVTIEVDPAGAGHQARRLQVAHLDGAYRLDRLQGQSGDRRDRLLRA